MQFSLKRKQLAVERSYLEVKAIKLREQQSQREAKEKLLCLLASGKGLLAAFAAGSAQSILRDKQLSASQLSTLVGRKLLFTWLAQSTDVASDSASDIADN
jgi:hypothetical protein